MRKATTADALALLRLAALDDRPVPRGRVVVAESGGEIVAAGSVGSGDVIANPWRRTAEIVELVRLRVAQLRDAEPDSPPPPTHRHARRSLVPHAARP